MLVLSLTNTNRPTCKSHTAALSSAMDMCVSVVTSTSQNTDGTLKSGSGEVRSFFDWLVWLVDDVTTDVSVFNLFYINDKNLVNRNTKEKKENY
jgi:hypothetical protein